MVESGCESFCQNTFGSQKLIMQARDALISVSRGRPRCANFEDVDVAPPCLEDFPDSQAAGELFIPYIDICCLLGDLIECCSRKRMSYAKRTQVESRLFRWTRTLAPHLRISQKRGDGDAYELLPYDLKSRQLHMQYFLSLAILVRSTSASGTLPPGAVLAASFAAGMYEDFLARDQVKLLPPVFTTFCLVSGIILLSVRAYPDLWEVAQIDLGFIKRSLLELSKRWRSAIGASKALQRAMETCHEADTVGVTAPLTWLEREQQPLLEGFSLDLCRMWPAWMHAMESQGQTQAYGDFAMPGTITPKECLEPALDQGGASVMDFNFMPEEGDDLYFTNAQSGVLSQWFTFD